MLPSDGGGRYAGPEHIEPRCSQTLLHYLIIFCKIYSATEGINTEFITFPCKYEHGEGGREAFRHSCTAAGLGWLRWGSAFIVRAKPATRTDPGGPLGKGLSKTPIPMPRCHLWLGEGLVSSGEPTGAQRTRQAR